MKEKSFQQKLRSDFRRNRPRYWFLLALVLPTFLLYVVFCIYPILNSAYTSLFEWSGYSADKTFVGLENYRDILTDKLFLSAIRNDVIITAGKEVIIVLLTVFFAVSLTRLRLKKREVGAYRFIFYIPNVLSVVVIANVWAFVYDPFNGLLNGILRAVGLDGLIPANGWIVEHPLGCVITVASWCGIGLFMIVLITAINTIPTELYEAARMDGAGEWTQLWYITMPEVWKQIKSIIVSILFQSLGGNFTLVQAMLGSAVNEKSIVMGLFVYQKGYSSLTPEVGYSYAAAVLLLIITATASLLVNRALTNRED